jgi:methylmalonyl-CoA mutase cobalamin-binding subunit
MTGWLSDIAGRTKDLIDEVGSADLVVMVATAGENASAAAIIGEACSAKRVNTTGLIVGGAAASDEALAKTLAQLRPWSLMLVIVSTDDYIEDMLTALRA